MSTYENKKKVRIQIDKDSHHQAQAQEKEFEKQKMLPFSKIQAIKHIKEQNVYQFRPNADIDGDYENPSHQDSLNSDIDKDHLDQWKKDLSLKTAQNADELKQMRKNHENSLKYDQKFPQVNMEILDSITRFPNDNQPQPYNDNHVTNTIKSLHNLSPKSSKIEFQSHSQFPSSSKSLSHFNHDTYSENSRMYDPNNRIYTSQGGKNIKFIQSNEAIQREVNKKLVNTLIFSRIQRTLEDNQITGKTKNEKSDGVSSINKQRADDIFKTEMSHFSNQTLANFKNLMNTFRRSNNLIEFEELSNQLSTYLNRPRGIFGTLEQKDEILDSFKDEKEERYHFKHMEKIMLANYKQLNQDINENTNKVKDMRQQIFEMQNKLSEINEQTRDYLLQIQKEVEQQEKALDNPSKKAFSVSVVKLKASMAKTQEDKEETLQQFRQQKDQTLSQINQYTESLNLCEREIKNLKDKKNITRNMLKSLYFQTMKSDKSLQKQSMVWIIRALLNINEDISKANVFPSILDEKSIQYLIDYSALESSFDKVTHQLKSKVDDPADQSKNDEFDQDYIQHQHQYNLAEYKDKVQKIAKKSNLKIGKPIFSHSSKNEYKLGWERAQDVNEKEEITFSLAKVPQKLREEMKHIMEQQQKMKDAEANRLIEAYLVYKDERKINELNQILLILFGELEGEEYFRQYEKKYMQHQNLVKNNKTFTFSKANLSTKVEKEDQINEQRIPIKGAVGSQTILNYRKGIDEDENKQIDQFALVKQVGKTFHKNKQEQSNTISSNKRVEIPYEILEKHNKMKKQINDNSNQMHNFNLIYPKSMTNIDSIQKPKNTQNRTNYLFGSFSNLPSSQTNIHIESPILKESPGKRSHTQSNFQIRTYKPHTPSMNSQNELESPIKQQNRGGILKNPSSKNFLQP